AWGWAVPVGPISDSHAYDTFARNLVQYGVFGWTADRPFAFWPPGTSMLYAAVYALFGFHHGALVVLHVLLSAVMLVSG
ncbi:hypothetical protein, partial [Staphylococcus aureus]|uniref:hypothetical protein n=1 Tax=Staphylococcus aureus TaxID=1280 RepID=UPI0021B11219